MTEAELQALLQARFPREDAACEWKEFKSLTHAVAGRKGEDLISYVSAIANMEGGHVVMGVKDGTLRIVGIQDPADYSPENLPARILGRCTHLDSEGLRVEAHQAEGSGKVIWVLHVPKHRPRLAVLAHGVAWQRVGDELVPMRPERLEAILGEPLGRYDWSAVVVPQATLDDLDPEALALARVKFQEHHAQAPFAGEIAGWSTATFLDKARLTLKGQLTRAALLLLGQAGPAAHHLSPHPVQITWKLEGEERAYQHFGPPFLLATTQLLQRIRNVGVKLFPANRLLATEVMKHDPRVILEALHNAVAHQDYEQNGRILVTERVERLSFESLGGFFEGAAEDYFTGERTPVRYRNPWLVQAMAGLGMIDTMGYGIHSMAVSQRKRFFPLPDYGRSTPSRVVLEVYGQAIDPNYSLLLLERADLRIDTVILLDRVQKGLPIPDAAAKFLRGEGLIEGRKPKYHVSAEVAATTGTQARYTRLRGLDKAKLKPFVLQHLDHFQTTSRQDLDDLLWPLLPEAFTPAQKSHRVKNLLSEMQREDRSIRCVGKGPAARWFLAGAESSKKPTD